VEPRHFIGPTTCVATASLTVCGQFPDWVQEAVLRAPPPVAVRLSADRGSKAETRPQDEAAGEGNDSWFGGGDGSSRSVDEHRGTAGVFDRLAHRCQWA